MAIEKIDQTTPYPDGSFGDDAFTAFGKVNNNFDAQQADIEAEQQARAQADNALSTRIDGLPTNDNLQAEIDARTNADTALGVRIDDEATARADADTALSQAIAVEVTARQNADTALGARFIGKNLLINGDFRFWQRATTSAAAAARRYVADRWEVWSIGTTTQVDAMVINDGSIDPPVRYAHRVIVSSVAGAGNIGFMRQHIEDVRTASGRTVTFSVRMYSLSASKIAVNIAQNFGVGGSDAVNTPAQKFDLAAGWQTVTATFNIPSVSGKTIGTSSSLILQIWMDAGADYNTVTDSLGQRSGTYWFANAQLELGSTATTFEQRNDAIELVLCQRYYEKSYNLGVAPGTATRVGCHASGLLTGFLLHYPVVRFSQRKRTSPAITLYNTADGAAGQLSENGGDGLHRVNHPAQIDALSSMSFETLVPNGTAAVGNVARFQWVADAEI